MTLNEAVGTETDLSLLAVRAVKVLDLFLPGLTSTYYSRDGNLWNAIAVGAHVPPDLAAVVTEGLPLDTPAFARAAEVHGPVFIDRWDVQAQEVPGSEDIGAGALYPYFLNGEPYGMLTTGSRRGRVLTVQDREHFLAVARSLGLAIDRAHQTAQLLEQRREADSRAQALEAFARLKADLNVLGDRYALIRRAQEVVLSLLPDGYAAYFEAEDGRWRVRSQVGEARGETLQAAINDGFPVGGTPTLDLPAQTRQPHFIDRYDQATDTDADVGPHLKAAVVLPVLLDGKVIGLFNVPLFETRRWSTVDRAVLTTTVRSLELALERGQQAEQLLARNAELEARTRALEAFAQLTTDLSVQVDPYALVRRAQEVAVSLLTPGYALYYERDGDRWRSRVQVGDVGHPDLQAFIDAGPRVGETPSVDRPWTTGQAYYQDVYAQGSDTPPEMVRHVGAAASLPVIRDGQTVGVFIAALFDQRQWTSTDRVTLETVVGSLGLALARSVQTQALEGERAGLDAFAAFTEAVGSETDVVRLAQQAVRTVNTALDDVSIAYYELDDDLWKVRAWSDDVDPRTVAEMTRGVPSDAPIFAEALQSGTAVFENGWDAAANHLSSATAYGMAALLPLVVGGQSRSILAAGIPAARGWTTREQTILRAVARGLALALERAETARQLRAQRDALDARTADLASANEELEAFTYSASHDLRTPVRHIFGFTELAQKALLQTPNPQAARHMDIVKQSALRMTALIDGMLMLSRVGQEQLRPGWVDLGQLVVQAQRDVNLEFAERAVQWRLGPLPRVWGSPDLLQQVMTNLISNAVKYSGERPVAQVRVWTEENAAEWTVSVQDNGVGFPSAYASRLFGVFQRLHNEKDFGGTGVGLATVRRIVQKHGGRVFAESTGSTGATFGFTLPKPPGH
ncbi:GAF domain-containing protein [Deinococcus aquiradiocola]|nr:GAF domain-containing protein [Deinococcus aquiradiocola]